MTDLPNHARVVIIGGGIMGCGLAYHLAHEGWTDVVLLEKAELTSGSTWHAAGQITHSTSSYTLGACVGYNIELYSKILEAETGQSSTWHGCGSLRLAYTQDEYDWLLQTMSVGRALGFPMQLVTPERIRELHPFYNLDGVLGALHTPDDGHVDPAGPAFALEKGARQLGTRTVKRCLAEKVTQLSSGEWQVETNKGTIICEHVVNAGGTYARQVALTSGYDLPATSMTHHYLVTDTVPEFKELDDELPVVRDDKLVSGYIRMEQKSGLIGIYEKTNPNTVWDDWCPWEAENELFEADYDRIMPWLENAMDRMPIFADLGIKREVHGAISHPPDGNPLIGPAPGLQNYWVNAGCQIGIGWGPGLTRELARWMVHGAADLNMRDFDPRRYGAFADRDYQIAKAKEDYILRHEIPFPHFNRHAHRPVKPAPLYETLKAKGAVYEEVYGWERPRWFATDPAQNGVTQADHYSFHRPAWFPLVMAEVRAVRTCAGLIDISAFAKIEVSGPDARALINALIPNRVPKPGRVGLTHMLGDGGRIELETTVVALAEDRLYLVCAAFFEQRLIDHLTRNRGDHDVRISNLSQTYGALALSGPRARDILVQVTDHPLETPEFKWLDAKEIQVAGHTCWALRLSYAGELGWEFHIPSASVVPVYEALHKAGKSLHETRKSPNDAGEAKGLNDAGKSLNDVGERLGEVGKAHGLVDYGSFAMNILRMEKMFKGAGELTNEVTLPEADVMRFVRMEKEGWLGREATQAAMESPPRYLCAYLEIEPKGVSDGNGGEAVLMDGSAVGSVSSIVYSPTVDKVLAFAYLRPEAAKAGQALQVVIMNEPRAAVVRDQPAYDPNSELPRT